MGIMRVQGDDIYEKQLSKTNRYTYSTFIQKKNYVLNIMKDASILDLFCWVFT